MKILYGVAGEGVGHATRSRVIIEELQKEHQILIAAGGKAYNILHNHFETIKIISFRIIYRNNTLSFLTVPYVILTMFFSFFYNLKLLFTMFKFNPDIIITDFEPFSCYLALLFNKKCISIDNQHIINTQLKIKNHFLNKLFLKSIIKLCIPKADAYLVTSFFYPHIIKKNTYLFPPINSKYILSAKTSKKDFIFVYQTSKSNKSLVPTLNQVNQKFVVYGFDKSEKISNVQFKKFSKKEFIKDISSCKAVITNGGFTLIGESLHLQKPIFSIPVKKQFEQIINANYVKKLGYGEYHKELTKDNLEKFIINLDKYAKNIKKYKKQNNSKILKKLKSILKD